MQPNHHPASQPQPWGRVSTMRLETFSDGVFAIAVTLLALQLPRPNLAGGLWSEHHRLLDPLETHGRRLPRANLWFLLSVSLLPYWVNVLATYPNNNGAAGLLLLWLGVLQLAFLQLCLVVRRELAAGSVEELVMARVIRATIAAVMLGVLGGLLVAQVQVPNWLLVGWLLLLVVGSRWAVQVWSIRHRRRIVDG
jgi:uncharacterized membrane protein